MPGASPPVPNDGLQAPGTSDTMTDMDEDEIYEEGPLTDDYGRYIPLSYEDLWDTREEYEGER